jgi:hypothetical protein
MEPIVNALKETKKQLRAFEVVVLVRIDETLRAVDGRVRSRLRKLGHGRARPVARKIRSKRSRPSLVAAA